MNQIGLQKFLKTWHHRDNELVFHLPRVIRLKLAKCTIMTSQQHALVQRMMMPAWQKRSSPWPALSENSIAWAVVRVENAFSRISHWVLGPSQGELPNVLFIQYQRYWRLNLNKEGHWTELSVWLPFRTAVNAILLIRLLKASLPARSLCEGNTMQAVQTPQKGIALESHTSAVWPLAVLGRSVESPQTPSQLQSGEQNRFSIYDSRCARQRAPRQMAAYCSSYLHFWMFGVGGRDAELCKKHKPVSHTWMWLRYETMSTCGKECFTFITVCTYMLTVLSLFTAIMLSRCKWNVSLSL